MNQLQNIDPNDTKLLARIRKAGAKGYNPGQVATLLNLPFVPFMYALMREPAVKHAWELGALQFSTKYLDIAEEIAADKGNRQRLAAAIYLHRHAVNVQEAAGIMRPEANALSMNDTMQIAEVIPPNVMQIAMDNYDRRNNNSGQD